jgi:hypothetical protein
MTSVISRIDRAFRAPAPPERLAALRILIGAFAVVYLTVRAASLSSVVRFAPQQYQPIGLARLVANPLPSAVVYGAVALAIVTGVCFVIGFRHRLLAPAFAFLLMWVTTYRNSWGMIFHTENLLVLHVLLLAIAPAADVWSLDARRRPAPEPNPNHGWPIVLISAVTVTTYVLAAVAKLRNSGLDWVTSDILRNYVAYDNFRKILLGDWHAPLGAYLVRHGWLFPPLAAASMVLELFAPAALLSKRVAKVWVLGVWGFHVGVWATMAIFFPYNVLGFAFLSFFPIERRLGRIGRRLGSIRASS